MASNPSPLRILSFNLRVAVCERGTPNAWSMRRDFCRDIIVQGGQLDRVQRNGRFPSDHYPLSASFELA